MVKKKVNEIRYFETVGRRKTATARVRLYLTAAKGEIVVNEQKIKKGEIFVNGHTVNEYFKGVSSIEQYMLPLALTNSSDRFAISVKVEGGGTSGQLAATIHGISRALVLADEAHKPLLRKEGLLTRDSRSKERRKVGTGGKARRKKQSPKR